MNDVTSDIVVVEGSISLPMPISKGSIVLEKIDTFKNEEPGKIVNHGIEFELTNDGEIYVTANGICDADFQAVKALSIDNLSIGKYYAGINTLNDNGSACSMSILDNDTGSEIATCHKNDLCEFAIEEKTSGRYIMCLVVEKNKTVSSVVFRPAIYSQYSLN